MKLKTILNHKVVKAGSWYTLTEVFIKGITFLTIPIFTRLLSTSDYGLASLYTTWVGIFTIVIGLNLNTSIIKGKYDYKENFDQFVSSVMFLSAIVFSAFLVVFMIIGDRIQQIIGFSGAVFYFMLFQSYFSFVRNSLIAKLRVEYKYIKVSILVILINILGILLSILLIYYSFSDNPYLGKVIGNGILIIISGIYFLAVMLKKGYTNLVNVKYWKYALLLCLPLIFHSLSNIINAQFDRIIISKYIGDSATGLYSFAYNVGMIMTALTHAFDQAWSPWVYEKMDVNKFGQIQSKGKMYRDFYTFVYMILLFMSPELVKIMADETYWESIIIIPYIFAGYYFSYMYTLEVKTELYYKKTNLISLGTILSAAMNIILNILFVPKYGYIAAAATTTISYFFLFVFHYLITSKIIRRNIYGFKFHAKSIIMMVCITLYFIVFIDSLIYRIGGIFLVSIYIFKILLIDRRVH